MSQLSPEAHAFLAYISSCPNGVAAVAALERRFGPDARKRVNQLLQEKLIEPAAFADPEPSTQQDGFTVIRLPRATSYRLTLAGRDALSAHDKRLEQQAQDKADKDAEKRERKAADVRAQRLHSGDVRRSWLHFFAGLLIGWLLGGFTPREAWDFLAELFGF